VGRGGTDFQPVMEAIEEYKATKVAILTDGYCYEPKYPSGRLDLVWVISPDGNKEVEHWQGQAIYMR
jgi:predicted metal-dependent peptidase